jgi:hypothetical protein
LLDAARRRIPPAAALAVPRPARTSGSGSAIAPPEPAGVRVPRSPARRVPLRLTGTLRLRVTRSFLAGAAVAVPTARRPVGVARRAVGPLSLPRGPSIAAALRRAPSPLAAWKLDFAAR